MPKARSQTGKLDIKSKLIRNSWMREGLVQGQSKSFWAPFKGKTLDAIIVQQQTSTAEAGHTIVMDYDGNFAGAARRGKEKAYGYGGVKFKFSDKLTAERLRYPINNGDKFDGVEIGDLSINEHTDSRSKLADNWVRQEDQFFFDLGTGYAPGANLTHGYQVGGKSDPFELTAADKLSLDEVGKISTVLKTGKGYTTGGNRRPIAAWQGEANNGQNPAPVYPFIVSATQAEQLWSDATFRNVVQSADIRGRNNMAINGAMGTIKSLHAIEAPTYYGYEDEVGSNALGKSVVEMSGLRRCAVKAAKGVVLFEGTEAYDAAVLVAGTVVFDRAIVVGKGAFTEGIGMDPDYKFQSSEDFGIDSESMMEWWGNAQTTVLKPEVDDYKKAKIGNMAFAAMYVDTFVEKIA